MDSFQPNTTPLPPALRALALGLLVETGVSSLHKSSDGKSVLSGQGEHGADGRAALWQDLRDKCGELSALVCRADDPGAAASYVLDYLLRHFDYLFELLSSQKRPPRLGGIEQANQVARPSGKRDANPA